MVFGFLKEWVFGGSSHSKEHVGDGGFAVSKNAWISGVGCLPVPKLEEGKVGTTRQN
jgi:hypothetical protein